MNNHPSKTLSPSHSASESRSPFTKVTRNVVFAALAATAITAAGCKKAQDGEPKSGYKVEPNSQHGNYHQERLDTRDDLNKVKVTDPNRVSEIERDLRQGPMPPEVIDRMQKSHEYIYEQYLNPGFMMYLKQLGLSDEVYRALDLVIQHPDDFEYRKMGDGDIEIVKRRPYKSRTHIPDDFFIRIEPNKGYVTRVGKRDFHDETGDVAWMEGDIYRKQMAEYEAIFNYQYSNADSWEKFLQLYYYPESPERTRAYYESAEAAYDDIDPAIQYIHATNNIDFPRRYIDLVRARGFTFEQTHPRFLDVVTHQTRQGRTYDAITKDSDNQLHVVVTTNPNIPNAYVIFTRANVDDPLVVDEKGYILHQQNGRWVQDPRYSRSIRTRMQGGTP